MWQRKQTIFLILALIALLLTAFFPLWGLLSASGMDENRLLFAVGWKGEGLSAMSGNLVYLVVDFILTLISVFAFKNRKRQMKLIKWSILLSVLFYAIVAFEAIPVYSYVKPHIGVVFPFVALILQWLAYKGVKHDDELVKAADRIR